MNEKSNDEILSQKLMKLQRNSRRGLLLFLLGFIGVVCTLVGWLFGQGEENKLPILLFTAVLLAGIATTLLCDKKRNVLIQSQMGEELQAMTEGAFGPDSPRSGLTLEELLFRQVWPQGQTGSAAGWSRPTPGAGGRCASQRPTGPWSTCTRSSGTTSSTTRQRRSSPACVSPSR